MSTPITSTATSSSHVVDATPVLSADPAAGVDPDPQQYQYPLQIQPPDAQPMYGGNIVTATPENLQYAYNSSQQQPRDLQNQYPYQPQGTAQQPYYYQSQPPQQDQYYSAYPYYDHQSVTSSSGAYDPSRFGQKPPQQSFDGSVGAPLSSTLLSKPAGYVPLSDGHPHAMADESYRNGTLTGSIKSRSLELKPRRFCCGCFKTRRGCCTFWWLFIIVFLACLGVVVFFLWPRIPTFGDPQFYTTNGDNGGAVTTNGSFSSASESSPFTLTLSFAVNESVVSENYINFAIKNLSISYNLLQDNGTVIKNAYGSAALTDSVLYGRSNTTFKIPGTFTYRSTTAQPPIDQTLVDFLKACGALGESKRKNLKLHYKAILDLPIISWLGIKPVIENDASFKCPLTQSFWNSISELSELLTYIESS